MNVHSIIPMSKAGVWGKPEGCTGYPLMAQAHPETEETPESAEGTASHEIAAPLIQGAARGGFGSPTRETFIGQAATNGVIFDDDMFDAAEMYANDVVTIMRLHNVYGGPALGIEDRIEAKRIHELSFGTCDSWLYDRKSGILYVWDYKYGHEYVDVFENWQLINYTAGILEKLEINGLIDQHTTVHFRIAQPRSFHRDGPIREWVVNASDLRGHFNILQNNAHKALSNDAEIHTGNHCKYCSARHACDPALKAGLSFYEMAGRPLPVELSPQAIGVQLTIIRRALKQLELLESGFETQVAGLIRSGVNVPGWATESGSGRERWAKPITEVISMGKMLGQDLQKPAQAITPNQARKLGIDETVIKAYSETPRTGIKIVPDNGNKTKRIFSQ